ncbi:DNA-binding transcriptional regulator, MarR family [Cribrihabitans marinus]|uniref:DNA-binding transcriptional regulator, MarR family n=1 Tax=Cribrihabitans marinus TaxID=1227549 RepID=A0A1H7D3Q3_9RHOB|nr:MarR family transcriptional regulator [Cribrihabitans marinus]GGH37360.1 MarR family transcriptional regulator [Cribrihabitans marinus]SEJ95477.1 DNA-binding transcriptional regulator, MarR family [Cribrihabitans marinus]
MSGAADTRPDPEPMSKARLRLWLKLLKASKLIEEEIRRRLRIQHGSTLPRFDVMSALARAPEGLKMSEISRRLRVSNGNITGIVDKLANEGLALRVAVPGDRRANRVRLTPRGQQVFAEQAAAHEGWIDGILGGLDADDIDGMIHRLDHLTDTLEATDAQRH